MQNITLVTAIVGAICGVGGLLLGWFNFIHTLYQGKVKLKVIPKRAIRAAPAIVITTHNALENSNPSWLCIEVINLSTFPITIAAVGFGHVKQTRQTLIAPNTGSGKPLPRRLEPREAETFYANPSAELDPTLMTRPIAYATTDSDETFYGTSPFLKSHVQQLRGKL